MRNIMITGATSGFGEAIALTMSKQECRLILTGRREERLMALAQQITTTTHTKVLPLVFDVRDNVACEKAIQSIPEEFKPIDVLVNNAGLAVELDPVKTREASAKKRGKTT